MGEAVFRGPDGSPRMDLAILAATSLGTILYAWWMGIIDAISTWGDGINRTIDGLAYWIEFDLFGGLFAIGLRPIETAWASNEAFIQSFGVLAQVVALLEAFAMVWIILATFSILLSMLRGAIS